MVTRDRADLARRSLHCFSKQTWPARELIIVDDGDQDYEPVIAPYREHCDIHYHRVENRSDVFLGGLRNISLDRANGDYCTQWDDDEWYHPERIATQMRALKAQNLQGVLLRWTLMHLDTPGFVDHPYRTGLNSGTPGTILHEKTPVRYPNLRKGEDTVFRKSLGQSISIGTVAEPHSHLFIRCFHGSNTWDQEHFTERLRYTWRDKWHYFVATRWRRDLFSHPRFQLSDLERSAVEQFRKDSQELGIIVTT